jgi:hypothetical protein
MNRVSLHRITRFGVSLLIALVWQSIRLNAQDTAVCSDCAELGRTAARLQMEELKAEDLMRQNPLSLADAYERDAREEYRINRSIAGDALWKEAEKIRASASAAKADAEKFGREAETAWQAYYDCLKKSKCPTPEPQGKVTTGFSTCPEAQEWLDRASQLHKMAERERGYAKAAKTEKNDKSAESFEQQAKLSDGMAREREREAAYALQRCADKQVPVADGPSAGAQTTENPATGGQTNGAGQSVDSGVMPGNGQPVRAGSAPPPGSIPLPHDGQLKSTITITNSCKSVEVFRIETSKLPEGMVDVSDQLRVAPESPRDFEVLFSSKGILPGLYSGSISVVCITCDATCPQQRKDFPLQIFVPVAP